MKAYLIILVLLSSTISHANEEISNWTLLAKINHVTNIHTSIVDNGGANYSNTSTDHLGFLGLGANYNSTLNETCSLVSELTVSQYIKNRSESQEDIYIAMVSVAAKYQIKSFNLYGGLSVQHMFPDYYAKKSPGLGIRLGAGYQFDARSSVSAGLDFMSFHTKGPDSYPYSAETELQSLAISYGYRI